GNHHPVGWRVSFRQRHRRDSIRRLVYDPKHPGKGWHDRLGYYRTRVVKVNILPHFAWLARADVSKVGASAFRTQQLWCLVSKIARRRWSPKNFVLCQGAHMLGMAITATIGDIYFTPFGFDRRERVYPWTGWDLLKGEPRQHTHNEGESCIDQCRTTGDQRQLVHVARALASAGARGTASALRPNVMRQTFQANTKWLRNIIRPPIPRQT